MNNITTKKLVVIALMAALAACRSSSLQNDSPTELELVRAQPGGEPDVSGYFSYLDLVLANEQRNSPFSLVANDSGWDFWTAFEELSSFLLIYERTQNYLAKGRKIPAMDWIALGMQWGGLESFNYFLSKAFGPKKAKIFAVYLKRYRYIHLLLSGPLKDSFWKDMNESLFEPLQYSEAIPMKEFYDSNTLSKPYLVCSYDPTPPSKEAKGKGRATSGLRQLKLRSWGRAEHVSKAALFLVSRGNILVPGRWMQLPTKRGGEKKMLFASNQNFVGILLACKQVLEHETKRKISVRHVAPLVAYMSRSQAYPIAFYMNVPIKNRAGEYLSLPLSTIDRKRGVKAAEEDQSF